MNATCPVPHFRDADRPRRTLDGHTICGGCTTGLSKDLGTLPRLHDDLVHLHNARRSGGQTKISGSMGARLPIDVVVADARAGIRSTVTEWASYAVGQARSANIAGVHTLGALNIVTGARWLDLNLDWVTRQDWAPNLATAIRQIRSRAIRMLDPAPRQQFPIPGSDGLCVRTLEDELGEDRECPGRLWVTIPRDEEQFSLIVCSTCYHEYPATSWMRLGSQIHARRTAAA